MLSKFISVSETSFQNTETALKNQQASIQGLETQIGQLSKLISERPQDDEGVVEPEPELRQETVVNKGQGEVDQNTNKSVNVEYKPRVPYPNVTMKDRSDEQFALLQMPNAMKFLKELLADKRKLDEASHVELNTEISLKEVHEPLSNNKELDEWRTHKPRTHDKPKLSQNELDTSPNQHKVGDKVLLDAADPYIVTTTLNEEIPFTVLNIFPFGTVEVSHPKFDTFKSSTSNLLTEYLNTGFPQRHGQAHGRAYGLAKIGARLSPNTGCDKTPQPCDTVVCPHTPKEHGRVRDVRRTQIQNLRIARENIGEHELVPWPYGPKSINTLHYSLSSSFKNPNPSHCNSRRPPCHARVPPPTSFLTLNLSPLAYTMSSLRGKKTVVHASKKRKGASSSMGPTTEIHHPLLQFPRGPQEELFQILWVRPLIAGRCIDWATVEQINPPARQLSVPEFGAALGLYTEEFKEENDLDTFSRHIHFSPSKCLHTLAPGAASYNPSHSKASVLPPSLRYLHAILAHTFTRRQEITCVVNTHDTYFLWCISHGHVINLAYFITLDPQHRGLRIIPHPHQPDFSTRHLEHAYHDDDREALRNLHSQYRLTQSTKEEAYEDIPNDAPHSTRTHRPSHHHPLVQFMRRLDMLTYPSASLDSSNSVFNELKTPPRKVLHDCHVHDHSYQ
ncbi:hypothetical protein GOBAR_AA10410 [Gossypium barbadense]|uniref:Uncharacterized protein n=1 Tax=Gossypium barbadense TaxID=3634 RepID=A0A2P5Y3V9_GOSBA|nr:hypothetical protein GOBAR_AA10410 [Gossypium barbadense]